MRPLTNRRLRKATRKCRAQKVRLFERIRFFGGGVRCQPNGGRFTDVPVSVSSDTIRARGQRTRKCWPLKRRELGTPDGEVGMSNLAVSSPCCSARTFSVNVCGKRIHDDLGTVWSYGACAKNVYTVSTILDRGCSELHVRMTRVLLLSVVVKHGSASVVERKRCEKRKLPYKAAPHRKTSRTAAVGGECAEGTVVGHIILQN